jgi:HD-GYP domain-containing protein (c-di-GMP phosphodiesterase class II)
MTSQRAYRRPLPHKKAALEILENAGSQFDPDLAKRFVEVVEAYRAECAARGEPIPE